MTPDGAKMALVQGDANTPAEVYLLNLTRPSVRPERLTRFGEQIRTRYAVAPVEPPRWRSGDDRFTVHGWLLGPADATPGRRRPLIVDVHGGPGAFYRNQFDALRYDGGHHVPPELYAAKGYLVLMVNPRGDPSYGRAYQESLLEGWEHPTREDIFTGVDEIVRRGDADPERIGIAGASYSGWVTAYAVSQTHRFKAAAAFDPVIDSNVSSAVAYRGRQPSNYWLHAGMVRGLLGDTPFPTVDPRLAESATAPEERWHYAQMLPRLSLAAADLTRVLRILARYRQDASSIVRTCVMQALFDEASACADAHPSSGIDSRSPFVGADRHCSRQ